MYKYLALRDRRLEGGVPARPRLSIVNVDEHTISSSLFHQIKGAASAAGGRIDTMFVFCHGFAGENVNAGVSMDAGGMGLELGRDCVLHSNVHRWAAIKDKVKDMVVYSCAAANTEQNNAGTTADGKYLMGALAIYTNATVYAADRIQWYNTYHGLPNGAFNFGKWEGTLWRFPPSGNPPTALNGAPVEFSDVLAGTAP